MTSTSRTFGERLVWQRLEHLLRPEPLAAVLNATHRCWPRSLLGSEASAARLRVGAVRQEALKGGVSGAHLARLLVEVELEQRASRHSVSLSLILKRFRPDESWLMRASGDTHCREVQIWRHGLLADAPRALCVPVLAAAYDEQTDEGAVLLTDVTRWLGKLEDGAAPVRPAQWKQYRDHLARLHAHYWQDARLSDPRFGLASLEQALLLLSPAVEDAELAAGDTHPYLPISRAGWEAFFTSGPAAALEKIQSVFAAPAAFLASAASAPATLVHGDAWPPNIGVLPGARGRGGGRAGSRTILIDWALATAGPATFDPFWLLYAWHKVDTRRALCYYRQRLTSHLARRGIALSVSQWSLLIDLGIVRTVLTCGESMGQAVLFARNAAQRAGAIKTLAWWVNWAARVIARRGWDR